MLLPTFNHNPFLIRIFILAHKTQATMATCGQNDFKKIPGHLATLVENIEAYCAQFSPSLPPTILSPSIHLSPKFGGSAKKGEKSLFPRGKKFCSIHPEIRIWCMHACRKKRKSVKKMAVVCGGLNLLNSSYQRWDWKRGGDGRRKVISFSAILTEWDDERRESLFLIKRQREGEGGYLERLSYHRSKRKEENFPLESYRKAKGLSATT